MRSVTLRFAGSTIARYVSRHITAGEASRRSLDSWSPASKAAFARFVKAREIKLEADCARRGAWRLSRLLRRGGPNPYRGRRQLHRAGKRDRGALQPEDGPRGGAEFRRVGGVLHPDHPWRSIRSVPVG